MPIIGPIIGTKSIKNEFTDILPKPNFAILSSHLVCLSCQKYLETGYGTEREIQNINFKTHPSWFTFVGFTTFLRKVPLNGHS